MQVEITLPNKDGVLMPGAYVQVSLPLTTSTTLAIPTNSLIIGSQGVRVAVVGENGLVTIRSVKIGRNYGQTVEALSGVTVADRLILNPSDSLTDGDKVTVVVAEKELKDSKGAKDGKK